MKRGGAGTLTGVLSEQETRRDATPRSSRAAKAEAAEGSPAAARRRALNQWHAARREARRHGRNPGTHVLQPGEAEAAKLS